MGEQHKSTANARETHTNNEQLEQIADRQTEIMRYKLEQAERDHQERQSQTEALQTAQELADSSEKQDKRPVSSPAERRRGPITKKQLAHSFQSQMEHVHEHLDPASRTFSKVIHNKTVEKVSDGVGATLARPNALLSGSIAAFLFVTILYFAAKYYGYQLSGFETIGAFILGWIVGILYDYFSLMIRGRRR